MTVPYIFIGISAALFSSLLTGTAFVMQKHAIDVNISLHESRKITLSKRWWFAVFINVVGELFNLVAYSFASPEVITPLGALSVVVAAILSHFWLKEQITTHGKIACLLCLLGSSLIVLHAPQTKTVYSINEFVSLAAQTKFVVYFVLLMSIVVVCLILTYKRPSITSIITVAAIAASLSVCMVTAVSQGIIAFLSDQADFSFVLFIFTGITIGTLITSLYYFNYALAKYNASQIIPIYYVLFTFYTLLTSSLLWGFETDLITAATIVISFLILTCGVFLLQKE